MKSPQKPPVFIKDEQKQVEDQCNSNIVSLFCPFCGKIFENQLYLGAHLSEHTFSNDCPFISDEENAAHYQVTHLVKCEYNTHEGKKIYSCSQCGKEFPQKYKLTRHLKIHSDEKKEIYSCSQCGKEFPQKRKLTRHLQVHSDLRPYQCSKCSKSFKSNSGLTQHLYLHEDEKRFLCDLCDAGFNHLITFKNHLRHHKVLGLPLLHCKICNRYYKSSQSYNVHLKDVHSRPKEEETWKCKECDCVFSIKCSLKTHIRRKHRIQVSEKVPQPWACSECERSYSTRKILNEHKRRKHKSEIKCEFELLSMSNDC